MKHIFMNMAVVGLFSLGLASCSDELNISSIDPQSKTTYDDMELLAKQYATLGLTGQAGPAGKPDISADEGETGFYRTTFNLQELCSDECIWAWQNDNDIPALTNIAWTAASDRVNWAYQRLAYDITLFNQYLSETETREGDDYKKYRAEVRFLRALHYWYFLDLFHKAPFKLVYNPEVLPEEKAGVDLYNWLDQELTEIEPELAEVGAFNNKANFGRADRGAAYALHARLALNSEVYTDGQKKDYQKAIDYCDKILVDNAGKYELCREAKNGYSGYEQLFMGDNDYNEQAMKEIIFPIRQDGKKTEAYAGSTYLINSMRVSGMPYAGTSDMWSCNFARKALATRFLDIENNNEAKKLAEMLSETKKYKEDYVAYTKGKTFADAGAASDPTKMTEAEVIAADEALGGSTKNIIRIANDDRALLYAGVGGGFRTLTTDQISGFTNGLSVVKWQNSRSDNSTPSDGKFSDTDIPLFRLAEIYLTRAEAKYRLNGTQDLEDINELRNRAHAARVSAVNLAVLLNEWGKEFYMEGRRRSDLVRFEKFAGNKYIWDFKGGVSKGTSVDKHFNVYPIPSKDTSNNPNMHQNPKYE